MTRFPSEPPHTPVLELAAESIKRLGFVVVPYEPFGDPVGSTTRELWGIPVGKTFIVTRRTTHGNWLKQRKLFEEIMVPKGHPIKPDYGNGARYYMLVPKEAAVLE